MSNKGLLRITAYQIDFIIEGSQACTISSVLTDCMYNLQTYRLTIFSPQFTPLTTHGVRLIMNPSFWYNTSQKVLQSELKPNLCFVCSFFIGTLCKIRLGPHSTTRSHFEITSHTAFLSFHIPTKILQRCGTKLNQISENHYILYYFCKLASIVISLLCIVSIALWSPIS